MRLLSPGSLAPCLLALSARQLPTRSQPAQPPVSGSFRERNPLYLLLLRLLGQRLTIIREVLSDPEDLDRRVRFTWRFGPFRETGFWFRVLK